ncbi:Adenosine deaminase 2-A [Pseudocercospora fuligena]|uniref:adenosine deaminase n=1 Tax=Pseudocercospora fuligena TaxID=685502 RepID=A0A8H6RUX4_9PEZI|nr:Adenosine deaminase 2-A [Pseudocercospora fuligena]
MASPESTEDADEKWCRENGLPSIDQPFIQKYLDGRDALVAQEKHQRADHAFREMMTPMAKEAAAVISAIRFQEEQTLWNSEFEDSIAKTTDQPIYPGMMFSLAKDRMETSKLWQIVRKMPKGCLLHCHLHATGDLDWLIEDAFSTPGICILAETSLHTIDIRQDHRIPFLFKFASKELQSEGPPLWSESYKPIDLIPIKTAAESFPEGSTEGFKKWVKSRMTLSAADAISHHLGPNDIWSRFIACFGIIKGLTNYEPIFRGFLKLFFRGLHQDGIKWVDIRCDFNAKFTREGQDQPETDYIRWFEVLDEVLEEFKGSEEGKGFWGATVIWTSIRQFGPKYIMEDMQQCIDTKVEFPDLLLGFDFVGQEDVGRPLIDLTPEIFWFKKKCAEAGVDIPFFFHAGETLGDGDSVDENLFDAVLLGTRRIGHGISLYRHPLLIEMVKEKKILIESCPVSNEVLRYTGSIKMNVLPSLIARGVPCCLANDDPAILGQGTNGMTHDFWQALQGWENLGLAGLASLAENSIRWANFEECTAKEWQQDIKDGAYGKGVRAERMREWAAEFEKFCAWVVQEYGADIDENSLD